MRRAIVDRAGYWRGYVWGPMAQLTYWSLKEYDHVPVVRSARKAMCKQMTAMFLNQWRLHAHICENFNPHKNGTEVRSLEPVSPAAVAVAVWREGS